MSKKSPQGWSGLNNIGNTCYLNSCLQILNVTDDLYEILDSKNAMSHLKETENIGQLLLSWKELQKLMKNKNNQIITPKKFVSIIHNLSIEKGYDFTIGNQNDVGEFMTFIINCFHSSICRPIKMNILGNVENKKDNMAYKCYSMLGEIYTKEYSEIMEMFYGVLISEIYSADSLQIQSSKPEPFFILELPLPLPHLADENKCTLMDCFKLYTKMESLTGDNKWFNEATNKYENARKKITFWNLPKILIVLLKRFSGKSGKNQCLVDFSPLEPLVLSKFIQGYNPHLYVYDLYGVCYHDGVTQHSGHYNCCVKGGDKIWRFVDDNNVFVLDKKNINKIVTKEAYCLFFRKK